EKLFGYEHEELLGRSLESLFFKSIRPAFAQSIEALYSTSPTEQLNKATDLLGRCKDGKRIVLQVTSNPLPDGDNLQIVHVIRDVTETKTRERRRAVRHAVQRILAEAVTLDQAISDILRLLCDGLGWDVAEFWTLDPRTQELRLSGARHAATFTSTDF